jgi:CubicO group peptidase (beta-lactamase class C family)
VATRGDASCGATGVRLEAGGALAVLVAAEEGVVDLDEAAGPPASTVRHLLAHTSGLPFEGTEPIARPEHRRIYSNEAFRVLAAHLEERAEMPFADYVREALCRPLHRARSGRRPGSGMHASLSDVLAFGREPSFHDSSRTRRATR